MEVLLCLHHQLSQLLLLVEVVDQFLEVVVQVVQVVAEEVVLVFNLVLVEQVIHSLVLLELHLPQMVGVEMVEMV
tara:strand:- start:464 stop:688 length:225 start_codon:yes stop_codon:yes gene_type:complete